MAGSPEDAEPFSPSIFLDLPPTPCRCHEDGNDPASSSVDLALPFISRMLMEDEDMNDSLFYPDHPALIQAQQPFAEILSNPAAAVAAASDANTTVPDAGGQLDVDDAADPDLSQLLQSPPSLPPADGDLQGALASPLFGGRGHSHSEGGEDDMLKQAFLKGVEEAKKFLPTTISNSLLIGTATTSGEQPKKKDGKQSRRCNDDEDDDSVGRTACSKNRNTKMVLVPDYDEADAEKVDKMFLNDLNTCLDNLKRLDIGGDSISEGKKNNNKKNTRNRKAAPAAGEEEAGDLHALLIPCAQAVGSNDREGAARLLAQIKKRSSPRGDPSQRLAHCFAEALETRLAGTGAQVYRSLVSKRTSPVEYLKAYQLYLDSCCFKMTSFTFSNRSILKAMAAAGVQGRKTRVHIVDYGIDYGLQWATFLTHFAPTETGARPEVRITGIDHPQPGFRPSSRLEETGRRLTSCARQLGVPFTFRSIASAKWETIRAEDLDIDPDELLVVNSLGPFGNLRDEGADVDSPSPRDAVLAGIRRLRPDLLVLCVVSGSYSSPFFVARFREALSYYTALFDMLDATIPRRDNEQRLLVERDLYGRSVLNVVACEGWDRVERPEAYRQWQARCRRAGLTQLPLDAEDVQFVKEKIRSLFHKDFVIDTDQQWLLKGWKGRILYAISTWVAHDDRPTNTSTQ